MKKIYPFSFYLLYYAANACLFPYWVLYYQRLGFNGTQIGLLSAIAPLVFMAGAPVWTGLADTTHRHKLVMGATLLVTIGLTLVYPALKTFGAVLLLSLIYPFMLSPANSFADAATMTMLGEQKDMYGRIRVGGTIGWGIAALVAGGLIEKYGLNWAFWLYAALMFVAFLVSQKFTFYQVKQEVSLKLGLRELLSNPRLVLFLSVTLVCGMALASINTYFSAYMAELGFGETVMGYALAIGTVAELSMFFFANLLLVKLKPHGMLILSMVATMVRLFLYATVTTQAGILGFQLINGVTYASMWVAGVSYINEIAPPGLSATAQGVFGAIVSGFGSACGGFFGAILLEHVGGPAMYAVFGALMFAALIVYLLLEKRLSAVEHVKGYNTP